MDIQKVKNIVEGALLAAAKPLSLKQLEELFDFPESEQPGRDQVRQALEELENDYAGRSVELKQVSSGYRFQVRQEYEPWIGRLWEERPPRYSRALLETLAIIAYRQPITRGEIEDIRGVSVSTSITRTLQERDWVRVVGHRDVPGKPALFGTTKAFLDYFNLRHLDELPTLAELKDLDSYHPELDLEGDNTEPAPVAETSEEQQVESEASDEQVADEGDNVINLENAVPDKSEQLH